MPGWQFPALEGWVLNKGGATTINAIQMRWGIPHCRTLNACQPVGWVVNLRVNGLRPGQMTRWRIDLRGAAEPTKEMQAAGMRAWPTEKVPAVIEVLAVRGM